jgi:hypothetical protein
MRKRLTVLMTTAFLVVASLATIAGPVSAD